MMPITTLLAGSAATPGFRAAVEEFLRVGRPSEALQFTRGAPPVKVERTLSKILEAYADLPIERVGIEGVSGCELFRGTAQIECEAGVLRVEFEWNCRWKAEQLGWTDWFGLPDQTRAAQEYGYDCFREWHERELEPAA